MLRLQEKSNRMYRCTVLCTRRDEGGVKDEGSSQYHNKGLFRVLISVCKIINGFITLSLLTTVIFRRSQNVFLRDERCCLFCRQVDVLMVEHVKTPCLVGMGLKMNDRGRSFQHSLSRRANLSAGAASMLSKHGESFLSASNRPALLLLA